jgi:hypothetical protein
LREKVYDDVGAENNGLAVYEYMSQDEVETYNYLCATKGRGEAEKYLKSIQDKLNQRLGEKIAEIINGEPTLQSTYGLTSGVDNRASEIASFLTGNDSPTATAYARELIRQDFIDKGGNPNLFDELESTGYSLPEIAAIFTSMLAGSGAEPKSKKEIEGKSGAKFDEKGIEGSNDSVGKLENSKPYTNNRPKYGLAQVEEVWNSNSDQVTGQVMDPSGSIITWDRSKPRTGQWDMGHLPGQKYSDIHKRYMEGEISLDEFLKWYRDPRHYRPELPSTNRSHSFER